MAHMRHSARKGATGSSLNGKIIKPPNSRPRREIRVYVQFHGRSAWASSFRSMVQANSAAENILHRYGHLGAIVLVEPGRVPTTCTWAKLALEMQGFKDKKFIVKVERGRRASDDDLKAQWLAANQPQKLPSRHAGALD